MKNAIIFGICLIILLSGCGLTKTGGINDLNLHSGTKGLTIKFLEQSPPPTLFQDSPFSMTLDIANEGAAPVDDGVISINSEEDLVTVQGDRVRLFTVEGRRPENIVGDKFLETIQLRTRALPPQTEVLTTRLGATVCYPYQTHAELTTCIDTDVFQRAKNKACTAKAQSLSGGQGGPVSVTKIEPFYSPHDDASKVRAEYLLTVRNQGTGQIYPRDKSLEACTPQPSEKIDWNKITINVILGDVQLTCAQSQLTLVNNEATVRCEMPGGISKTAGTYTTTLTADIDYGYSVTLTKTAQIKR